MKQLTRAWRYVIADPSVWLLCCFFQPARFRTVFNAKSLGRRMYLMARSLAVIFLLAFPVVLVTRVLIFLSNPAEYSYSFNTLAPLSLNTAQFIFDALWATAVSCVCGTFFCGLFSTEFGIAAGLAISLADGIIVNTSDNTLTGIVFGIVFGLTLGLTFNSAGAIQRDGLTSVTVGSAIGVLSGLVVGVVIGTFGGYWAGTIVGNIGGSAIQNVNYGGIQGSIAGLIVGGIGAGLVVSIIGAIVRSSVRGRDEAVDIGNKTALAVACAFGAAVGIAVGDVGMHVGSFMFGIEQGDAEWIVAAIAFLICYVLSYYRLPLYPISAFSLIKAYTASRNNPPGVFDNLRRSSLHWDECVYLPLPYLKHTLSIAAAQNPRRTLDELDFIVQQRPQQRHAAQYIAYALALQDLSDREILRDIGQAHLQLAIILSPDIKALSQPAATVFRHLEEASQEAGSYAMLLNRQDRYDALERMTGSLIKIRPETAFRDARLNRLLTEVIRRWFSVARQGQDSLRSVSENLGHIENPYIPGQVLELGNSLFVGRDDIAQKLGEALRRTYRPTFFLFGERRMGKSSILKQLPLLLGSRYLPVFYDLQKAGMLANPAAFFDAIADGIAKTMREKGFPVKALERGLLDEALSESETSVYDRFETWFREVEQILEREDRTLLLAFDEFEELTSHEGRRQLDLKLLFGWFRSIIQNRPRLALLFSGARTPNDLGENWSGYFVNVELLKVSFLRDRDAQRLITHPVPHFDGVRIFGPRVIADILRVTRGHPFLLQAVCKQLVETLNDESREQATPTDIARAIDGVFDAWTSYFWDIWVRSDSDLQRCLLAIHTLGPCPFEQIAQSSNLEPLATHRALEKLQRRDLIQREGDTYSFAVPLFAEWLSRTRHLLPQ